MLKGGSWMKYYILKTMVKFDDKSEESYGIMFLSENGKREYVCNISDNYEKISDLVNEMNLHNVESFHAREIIEDLF